MIIIADSNIFMSALISPNGETASILAERKKIQYIVPDYLITEVTEHIPDIVKRLKNQKTKKQLLADFKELLEGITIVNIKKEVQKSNIQKAELITEDVDYDDYPFIALHLQVNHKIWTSDKILVNGLTEKGYGNFFISTEELKTHLYKKKPKK
ncbi:PIN domain-containing protein [Capnocytophaga granulosa]|jgi:hypothetical protein|uniref:PIN domain-containing protein n=1 Tax=Capnocytophaga granulosa TaxID=45242 RepID=A0A1H2RF86_9FLAO|nr:PIN domain-containing protein [Capnocytophaga granulosa]EPD30010.1 hypothetical protein HMPREF9331_00645 [Capnocytophaga granulosa ATCC 51502]SDW17474.1 PIN domain-containing protein [Capnocytophaga granulosa]SUX21128.1 Predicted nucleotide-binding protein [Capnocytophaga granulosa]